jgi:hypothetical protein
VAVVAVVALAALPLQLPVTFPVTFPVSGPTNEPALIVLGSLRIISALPLNDVAGPALVALLSFIVIVLAVARVLAVLAVISFSPLLQETRSL